MKGVAMKIAHRDNGAEHPPLIIAEIGINHGGDLDVAKNMVRPGKDIRRYLRDRTLADLMHPGSVSDVILS